MGGNHHFHPSILKCLAFGYQAFEKRAFFLFLHPRWFLERISGCHQRTYPAATWKLRNQFCDFYPWQRLPIKRCQKNGNHHLVRSFRQKTWLHHTYRLKNSRLKQKKSPIIEKEHHLPSTSICWVQAVNLSRVLENQPLSAHYPLTKNEKKQSDVFFWNQIHFFGRPRKPAIFLGFFETHGFEADFFVPQPVG